MTDRQYSVQTIQDYLLGSLSEPETERLDELSVTDDDVADAVRSAEHDLVDSYARGELQGVALDRFRAAYLTTGRLGSVRFAEALQALGEKGAASASAAASVEPLPTATRSRGRSRWTGMLALAAGVSLLVAASAWLVLDNRTLRARASDAESARDALQRERQLQDAEAARLRKSAPSATDQAAAPLTVAILVLTPQLRSAGQAPTVALTPGSRDVALQLDLEPVDYPAYQVVLTAPTGTRELWRVDRLSARTIGNRRTLDVRVPAAQLGPQGYVLRVSGVPARGAPEIVGEYAFTVVR